MESTDRSSQRISHQPSYLFWPSVYPFDSSGYLIGWRKESFYFIASLVESESVSVLSQQMDHLDNPCEHTPARILGRLNPELDPSDPLNSIEEKDDWVTLIPTDGTLKIKGFEEDIQILIFYDRPSMRKHHFLSLRPLLKPSLLPNQFSIPLKSVKAAHLARNMKMFDEIYPEHALPGGCGHPREMSIVIDFVNFSEDLDDRVHHRSNLSKKMDRRNLNSNHHSARSVGSSPLLLNSVLALSTFLQQLNVRLVEISSWPTRYRKITQEEVVNLPARRAEYVMLFNTLWLIANDIIFGRSSGLILMENCDLLAEWLEYHLQTYTVVLVKKALDWTNSYPVGLKLNDQLGQVFCSASKAAIDFWHIFVLKYAFLALPNMIWIAGLVSSLGTTFTLAIASDFLTIATFHLWGIYRLFTLIFDCQLKFLGVLFNIFRGRKYNVLRQRNEPATYQLDQLILGTILFTLTIFLFPTVLAFYMLTSSARVLIIWAHGVIGTGLSLLNHFPLFVLMLRLKDPARLPAGICFIPLDEDQPIHFKLQNVPVGLTWIFADYISLWANLTAHYSPRQLLYHLCSGKPIAPLASYAIYKRP